mmetsp:Transcript_111641/g.238470  ORF Transcript_111641/g.238470 Transcript_111641/m.238470 type:complete len:257 (-) Transcript_111641:91-861(-)
MQSSDLCGQKELHSQVRLQQLLAIHNRPEGSEDARRVSSDVDNVWKAAVVQPAHSHKTSATDKGVHLDGQDRLMKLLLLKVSASLQIPDAKLGDPTSNDHKGVLGHHARMVLLTELASNLRRGGGVPERIAYHCARCKDVGLRVLTRDRERLLDRSKSFSPLGGASACQLCQLLFPRPSEEGPLLQDGFPHSKVLRRKRGPFPTSHPAHNDARWALRLMARLIAKEDTSAGRLLCECGDLGRGLLLHWTEWFQQLT